MNYIKKLCILKQLSSGFAADGKKVSALLTAESFAGRLTLSLALIGFAPLSAGRYRLLLLDEHGTRETFDIPSPAGLTVKKNSTLDISDGFGCLVCFAGNRITPVAFGKCGDKTYDVKKMCASLDEEESPKGSLGSAEAAGISRSAPRPSPSLPEKARNSPPDGIAYTDSAPTERTDRKEPDPIARSAPDGSSDHRDHASGDQSAYIHPAPDGKSVGSQAAPPKNFAEGAQRAVETPPPYDDEVVATENYFEFEDVDKQNLTIREKCDGNSDKERGKTQGSKKVAGEDEDAQSLFRFAGSENLRENERACYYDQVKGELRDLFTSHPAEEELEKCVPFSRWARVTFARNKYYTVGVISDENRPKYICYGVPADRRDEPPEALKGKCSFLPLSLFDPDGKGYWMMFQDAETGQCVKISQK